MPHSGDSRRRWALPALGAVLVFVGLPIAVGIAWQKLQELTYEDCAKLPDCAAAKTRDDEMPDKANLHYYRN